MNVVLLRLRTRTCGDSNVNRGSLAGPGDDLQIAADHVRSLLHADETETAAVSTDSLQVLSEICEIYAVQDYETQVLAASLRHPMHVIEAARMGAHISTMPFKVFEMLVKHPLTDAGHKRFMDDWEEAKSHLGELLPSMQEA